jgi:hypothetical protein
MRKFKPVLLTVIPLLLVPFITNALVLFSTGLHYGMVSMDGDLSLGKLASGQTKLTQTSSYTDAKIFGIHLDFDPIPVFDLRIDLEYLTTDLSQSFESAVNPDPLDLLYDYKQYSLGALGQFTVFNPQVVPIAVYVGAGAGFALINTEQTLTDLIDNILYDQLDFKSLEQESTIYYMGALGLKFNPKLIPIKAFAEVRLTKINLTDAITSTAFVIGASLGL